MFSLDCSRVLEYAKIRTVLQSMFSQASERNVPLNLGTRSVM